MFLGCPGVKMDKQVKVGAAAQAEQERSQQKRDHAQDTDGLPKAQAKPRIGDDVGSHKQRHGITVADVHRSIKKIRFRLVGLVADGAAFGHFRKMSQVVGIGVGKEIAFVATWALVAGDPVELGTFGKSHGFLFQNAVQR